MSSRKATARPLLSRPGASTWVALALALSACVKNPVTGTRELSLLSPEDERRIGEQAAREVESSVGLVQDERLLAYVREIGGVLATYSPRHGVDYSFDIVDSAEPNAFALPDGHIYVSRGLLALSNHERELSNILGHEIGHVAARHLNQRFSRAAPVGILAGVTSAVVGIVSDDAARSVAGVGAGINAVILAPHGRDQERQADRVGQDIAHQAGWDPMGLPDALDALGRMAELRHGHHETSFFDSHPTTPERVATTRAHARAIGAGTRREPPRDEYVQHLDGLLLGDNAAYGVFEGQRFVHPDLAFAVSFPTGWTLAHSKKLAGAQAPGEDAICVLGAQGPGHSPVEAAERFRKLLEVKYESGPDELTINDKPAARARVTSKDVDLTLTFILHEGLVFQLLALSPRSVHAKYASSFDAWATSFETATPRDLDAIHETRLVVARVDPKSTLDEVLQQRPSPLPPLYVAILNGMQGAQSKLPGAVLKVPVSLPYGATAAR